MGLFLHYYHYLLGVGVGGGGGLVLCNLPIIQHFIGSCSETFY